MRVLLSIAIDRDSPCIRIFVVNPSFELQPIYVVNLLLIVLAGLPPTRLGQPRNKPHLTFSNELFLRFHVNKRFTPKKVNSFMNGDFSCKPNAENLRIEGPVEPIYKGARLPQRATERKQPNHQSKVILKQGKIFEFHAVFVIPHFLSRRCHFSSVIR